MTEPLIEQALTYAKHLLGDKKRLAGDTVFDHSYRVYKLLCDYGVKDEPTLVGAILHSCIELPDAHAKEIAELFGPEIAKVIKNYNILHVRNIDKDAPREFNEAYIMQAYINMADDIRTLAIRIADRADNLTTSLALPKEKRISIADKVLYLYAPLAKLIGFGKLSSYMEDEAFKILKPADYFSIETALQKNSAYISRTLEDTHAFVSQTLEELKISAVITKRLKHKFSLYKKMLRYQTKTSKTVGITDIYDYAAMRIIVNSIEECYLVETTLQKIWESIDHLRDDYIATPRKSGYQSLQLIYRVANDFNLEVQIRTHEMHEFNEFGPASPLLYKIGDKGAKSLAYAKFQTYTTENKYLFKDLNFEESLQLQHNHAINAPFTKNVYAFTPKGDIIELPKGASLVDFAYALHSDIGNNCVGGYANKVFVPLDYTIQDGDYIEIKTINKVNANDAWLKFTITDQARSNVRKVMRNRI